MERYSDESEKKEYILSGETGSLDKFKIRLYFALMCV